LFLDAKEAHDNVVRCAYDHVGGENRRRNITNAKRDEM
jgi:hypothetical protein